AIRARVQGETAMGSPRVERRAAVLRAGGRGFDACHVARDACTAGRCARAPAVVVPPVLAAGPCVGRPGIATWARVWKGETAMVVGGTGGVACHCAGLRA